MKLKFTVLFLAICYSVTLASSLPTKSVVKIFASIAIPNYQYPWQTSKILNFIGSGVIIKDNQILTSAHVVSGARFIEIKKENDPNKYLATVKYISNQADLALLKVKDKSFFIGTNPIAINTTVKHRDEVTVLGYPLGGNAISTTTGVISRIEYNSYTWSNEELLTIQIDAPVNSGNSGGAAVNDKGELVGIAMQKLQKSSNIAYIVPSIVVNTFLEDVKDGVVNGFEYDTNQIVNIENEQMKQYYRLNNGNGVLVTRIGIDEKTLKVDDIILSIDNKVIANNGTVQTQFGRVNYKLAMHTKQLGDTVQLKVLRNKKIIELKYKIQKVKKLINKEFNKEPRYLIYSGLVFSPLTDNYLLKIMQQKSMNMLFYNQFKTQDYLEPVVWLQTVFPLQINRGYHSGAYIVEKVNGIKIRDFKHFVSTIENIKEEFTTITFRENKKVILNTKKARDSFKDLKRIYRLVDDRRVQ